MRKHQLQVHKLTILSMMIALDVVLTPIFRIEGMAPMSSVVNILAGIMMGPAWEKLWEQVLLVLLFPILLWYSLQDQLLSLAGLSTRLDFSEQP